jgi:uncharacterized membrane protein YhaH (DUF805 family)
MFGFLIGWGVFWGLIWASLYCLFYNSENKEESNLHAASMVMFMITVFYIIAVFVGRLAADWL